MNIPAEIIRFCATPKTQEQIRIHLRPHVKKYTDVKIYRLLKQMVLSNQLKQFYFLPKGKGGPKHFYACVEFEPTAEWEEIR